MELVVRLRESWEEDAVVALPEGVRQMREHIDEIWREAEAVGRARREDSAATLAGHLAEDV